MPERRKTVLIVDDDEGMRDTLSAVLRRDFRLLKAATGEAALQIMEKEDVDLMILDVRLPGIGGLEVLKIVKENYSYVEVIVASALKDLDTAVEAMRHGAYHYISKDFDIEGVKTLIANASERQDLSRHVMRLSAEVAEQNDREFIVGPSRATRDIIDLVQKIAKLSATVLILGESGTGKELLALAQARRTARRLEQLTQEYWELKYLNGELRVQLKQLTGGATPQQATPTAEARDSFVPLTSLRR